MSKNTYYSSVGMPYEPEFIYSASAERRSLESDGWMSRSYEDYAVALYIRKKITDRILFPITGNSTMVTMQDFGQAEIDKEVKFEEWDKEFDQVNKKLQQAL